MSLRYPFFFKHTTLLNALERGLKLEICYAPGILNSDGGNSRRNLISNATQLIRATRGRGIVISSEAKKALTCRGPADVVNMAVLWGLGQEQGTEAVGREARSVVVQAEMRRRSFRGVIDVVYGGEKFGTPKNVEKTPQARQGIGKRKATVMDEKAENATVTPKPISKREQKRQAKKARLESAKTEEDAPMATAKTISTDAECPPEKSLANGEAD